MSDTALMLRTYALAALLSAVGAYNLPAAGTRVSHATSSTRASVRLDEDRCYYGKLDADGNVLLEDEVEVLDRVEPPTPSPLLSVEDVVNAQFQALSYGDRKGILAAHAFVSPTIVQEMGVDAERFEAILGGIAFEGLIGCASWTITGTNTLSDDEAAVRLRVLPRPIPGCVKLSGMADQDGITWPAFYSWQMRRQAGGEFDGCWMLYQMQQAPPPIDVESDGGTPRVAAG